MAKKPTNRQRLRSALLFLHRWLGLISGIVVFIVAITGCMYVFEEEIRDITNRKYLYVDAPPNGTRQPLNAIVTTVETNFPKEAITQVRFKEKANAATIIYTKNEKAISINPYTLHVIGVRNMKNEFFDFILDLHRHLCWGEIGGEIIKWNVLIFFVLCVTGLIMWWPKQRRFLKQAITIKFRTKNWKRLNWDLHSVLGFYSLIILFIISLTGIFWTFDWAKDAVRFATNTPKPKEQPKMKSTFVGGTSFTFEQAYIEAKRKYPGAMQTFITTNPGDSFAPLRVLFRYPYTLVRKQNAVFFDKYSGKILREELFKNYTGYDKVSRSNYSLHTGNIPALGLGSKIIYFLASLFAASLPVTGTIMWLGRRKKAKKKDKAAAYKLAVSR